MAEAEKQTIFNSALASLERLHNLLTSCNEYSTLAMIPTESPMDRVRHLKTWKYLVKAMYQEISVKLSPNQIKLLDKAFVKFNSFPHIITPRKTPEGVINMVDFGAFNRYANYISKIERYLRIVADKKGMLIPDSSDDLLKPDNW